MELNHINSMGMSNISDPQMNKSKSISSVENSPINKPLEVDKIETTGKIQSSFSANVINNISKISKMQSVQPELSKQVEIVNKIETLTKEMISNPPEGKVLDDIQPEIQNLMDSFNTSSKAIAESLDNVANLSNDEKSRMYFDGIVGSRPLSGKEIFEAVTAQRERLSQANQEIKQEVKFTIEETKNVLNTEKKVVETKPAVKNVNFEVESNKFDMKSVQSFEGSVVETQANAQQEQNIKLLAS